MGRGAICTDQFITLTLARREAGIELAQSLLAVRASQVMPSHCDGHEGVCQEAPKPTMEGNRSVISARQIVQGYVSDFPAQIRFFAASPRLPPPSLPRQALPSRSG